MPGCTAHAAFRHPPAFFYVGVALQIMSAANMTRLSYGDNDSFDPETVGVITYVAVGILIVWALHSVGVALATVRALKFVSEHPEAVFTSTTETAFISTLLVLFTKPKPRVAVPWVSLPLTLQGTDISTVASTPMFPQTHVADTDKSWVRLWCDGKASFQLTWSQSGCRAVSGRALYFPSGSDVDEFVRLNLAVEDNLVDAEAVEEDPAAMDAQLAAMTPTLAGSSWYGESFARASGDHFVGGIAMSIADSTETPLLRSSSFDNRPFSQLVSFNLGCDQAEQMTSMFDPATLRSQAAVNSEALYPMAWVFKVTVGVLEGSSTEQSTEVITVSYVCPCVGHGVIRKANKPSTKVRIPRTVSLGDKDGESPPDEVPQDCETRPPTPCLPEASEPQAATAFHTDIDEDADLLTAMSDPGPNPPPARHDDYDISTPMVPPTAVQTVGKVDTRRGGHYAIASTPFVARPGPAMWNQHLSTEGDKTSGSDVFGFLDIGPRLHCIAFKGTLYHLQHLFDEDDRSSGGAPTGTPFSAVSTPQMTPTTHSRHFDNVESESDDELGGPDFRKCIVCFADLKRVILIPCTHYDLCGACAAKLESCPTCRTKIEAKLIMGV